VGRNSGSSSPEHEPSAAPSSSASASCSSSRSRSSRSSHSDVWLPANHHLGGFEWRMNRSRSGRDTPLPFRYISISTISLQRHLYLVCFCDTGVVFVTRVWRESKVIRLLSIIHSGIILDLVCGFGMVSVVVLVRMFVLIFFLSRREISFFLSASARVRSGDPGRSFSRGSCVPPERYG